MDSDGSLLLISMLFVFLLLLGGFFTLAQTSIIALSDSKLKKMCEDKVKKALRVQRITEKPGCFKGTAEFGFFTCIILNTACAFLFYFPLLEAAFLGAFQAYGNAGAVLAEALALPIVLLCIIFLTVVVSRTIPYHIGGSRPERYAFACARVFPFFAVLLFPGVKLVQVVSAGVSRLFGADPNRQAAQMTEEEIRMMMDVGNEKGVIEPDQMEMINNIFEFDDTTAADVMTHRTNIVSVPKKASISDVVYLAVNEGFSRIPVYDEDIDNIIGAVYVKDLLVLVTRETSDNLSVDDFTRPIMYIPDSAKLPELFRQLGEKKAHLAVVIDEYGGTAGILTMEDLVEAVMGSIQDEYDEEDDEIIQLDENTFTLDGGVELEDLEKALNVPFAETDDYDTLSGLIIDTLGRIPSPSEEICVTISGVEFTVLLVEDRRIARVKAVKLPPEEPSSGEENAEE